MMMEELIPKVARVIKIVQETPDVKTFRLTNSSGQAPFRPRPGQFGMLSLPTVGEAAFSITNYNDQYLEMAIKNVGQLTQALHEIEEGQDVALRGPYGNGFPLEYCRGRDLLFIGGGIGLAPLRSFIIHCLNYREDFGQLSLIYGAKSKEDLCFREDLFQNWPNATSIEINLAIDREEEFWDGRVCYVPSYLEELAPKPQVAIICGPPVMIKYSLPILKSLDFQDKDIITTLEMRMKCGIGKCGRCNIGSKYVCLDGPVFTLEELKELPEEY